ALSVPSVIDEDQPCDYADNRTQQQDSHRAAEALEGAHDRHHLYVAQAYPFKAPDEKIERANTPHQSAADQHPGARSQQSAVSVFKSRLIFRQRKDDHRRPCGGGYYPEDHRHADCGRDFSLLGTDFSLFHLFRGTDFSLSGTEESLFHMLFIKI